MRNIQYLSPTAIGSFYKNTEQYYVDYLADAHPKRFPQTQPMSIGSAFDAYVKSALHKAIFGEGADPAYDRDALFEKQVESHNRDWALKHGEYVYQCYRKSGAFTDMLVELKTATKEPKFEIEIRGPVVADLGIERDYGNMILLGKPDLFYYNKEGFPVILDWKVNGYCGNSNKSPSKGYVRIRHCDGITPNDKPHKDAQCGKLNGQVINMAHYLEDIDKDWAAQLSIYGWLLGQDVGSPFLTCIDQIVAKPNGEFPTLRIAEHRTRISKSFQENLFKESCYVWDVVHSDHIFRDLSKIESQKKCATLDSIANVTKEAEDTEDPQMKELMSLVNKHRNW